MCVGTCAQFKKALALTIELCQMLSRHSSNEKVLPYYYKSVRLVSVSRCLMLEFF